MYDMTVYDALLALYQDTGHHYAPYHPYLGGHPADTIVLRSDGTNAEQPGWRPQHAHTFDKHPDDYAYQTRDVAHVTRPHMHLATWCATVSRDFPHNWTPVYLATGDPHIRQRKASSYISAAVRQRRT